MLHSQTSYLWLRYIELTLLYIHVHRNSKTKIYHLMLMINYEYHINLLYDVNMRKNIINLRLNAFSDSMLQLWLERHV